MIVNIIRMIFQKAKLHIFFQTREKSYHQHLFLTFPPPKQPLVPPVLLSFLDCSSIVLLWLIEER